MVTQAGKAACAGKNVCPGCRRCSYVFKVARVALLRLVGGSTLLWGPIALQVHFVPIGHCFGCWRRSRLGNLSPLSCRPFGGAACLVALLLVARGSVYFPHTVAIGSDALQGAEVLGEQLAG